MIQTMTRGGLIGLLALAVLLPTVQAQVPELEQRLSELESRHQERLREVERRYEARISGLENEIKSLRSEVETVRSEDLAALGDSIDQLLSDSTRGSTPALGQTTIFSNLRNPAIGVVGDFIYSASTADDDFDLHERFRVRGVELSIAGEVDENLEYYVNVHIDEEDFELEEAYAYAHDLLPANIHLKFGRFNMDHGKTSPLHEHELPFVDKPGVVQEFLGGSIRGTGVELGTWTTLGDSGLFRVSFGVFNSPDSDAHVVGGPLAGEHHHHDDEIELPGERDLANFAYNFRVTAVFDIGRESSIQLGASVLWAPERRTLLEEEEHEHDEDDDEDEEHEEFVRDLEKLTISFDVTFTSISAVDGSGWKIQAELFFNDEEFGDAETGEVSSNAAFGGHIWAEHHFDTQLSVGLGLDWFESRFGEDDNWDAGAWVTWHFNEANRLRLELRYYDLEVRDEDEFLVMIQWTTIIGTHGHQLPW